VCHPGLARTDIFQKEDHGKLASIITDWAQWLTGQSAESGALPVLYCATSPELQGELLGALLFSLTVFGPRQPLCCCCGGGNPVLLLRTCMLLPAGKGATFYGAWYKGPFTINMFSEISCCYAAAIMQGSHVAVSLVQGSLCHHA
jgi:hypothetical protein